VRLIDFALAYRRPSGLARWFSSKKSAGTRSYMSPEQIRGHALDGRADIYSFGCTCYELATGRPPFRGKDVQELMAKQITEKPISPQNYNANISDDFAKFILFMLAKKKEERPKNFHEVLMAVRNMRLFKELPKSSEKNES
jgi:serine/threonine protein kinase